MARATYIHLITTPDINTHPVVAAATVKHELISRLCNMAESGTLTPDTPWYYTRFTDAGAQALSHRSGFFFAVPETEGAPTAWEWMLSELPAGAAAHFSEMYSA